MKRILTLITLILILAGCKNSNHVTGNFLIQKRKYTKGFHISPRSGTGLRDSRDEQKLVDQPAEVPLAEVVEQVSENKTEIPEAEKSVEFSEDASTPLDVSNDQNKVTSINKKLRHEFRHPLKPIRSKRARFYSKIPDEGDKDGESDDDLDLIIGLILCFLGLAPFGVLVALGKGREFSTNLILWLASYFFMIIGIVSLFFLLEFEVVIVVFVACLVLAGVFSITSFIHALVTIIRELK